MLGFIDSKSSKTQWDETLSPHLTNVEKVIIWKKQKTNDKNVQKNVYRLKFCWGNVVCYVVKDSWTKHNQFTTELCCIVTKLSEMKNKYKTYKKRTKKNQWLTVWRPMTHISLGPTSKAQKSLLMIGDLQNPCHHQVWTPAAKLRCYGTDHTDPTRTVFAV